LKKNKTQLKHKDKTTKKPIGTKLKNQSQKVSICRTENT